MPLAEKIEFENEYFLFEFEFDDGSRIGFGFSI